MIDNLHHLAMLCRYIYNEIKLTIKWWHNKTILVFAIEIIKLTAHCCKQSTSSYFLLYYIIYRNTRKNISRSFKNCPKVGIESCVVIGLSSAAPNRSSSAIEVICSFISYLRLDSLHTISENITHPQFHSTLQINHLLMRHTLTSPERPPPPNSHKSNTKSTKHKSLSA